MKPTRRLFAILLVLAMLLTNSGMSALAEAVLNMPAALQIIDEEAFYGSTSIDKVVLSDNVTEIRARAFANSTLSEINLPDSITYIDDTAFDGPSKVTLLVNEGSYAYTWAVRNNYIRPATSVALNKSSASLQVGDTISLTATVVPTNTTDDVIWASSDPYVINVDDQGNALATGVGTASITVTAGSYSASCNVNVAKKQQQLTISSITAGQSEGLTAGDALAWSVEITGAEGIVSYTYTLMRDGQQIAQTIDTPFNTYQTIADKAGSYQLFIECTDSSGTVSANSDTLIVKGPQFDMECYFDSSKTYYAGDTIFAITVTDWRGVISYRYELLKGIEKEPIWSCDTNESTVSIYLPESGDYFIKVTATNQAGDTAETTTDVLTVQDESGLPAPPELVFGGENATFGLSEETAPFLASNAPISLNWNKAENAGSYGIMLEKKENSQWLKIIETTTDKLSYVIPESQYEDVGETTYYRVSLTSVGDHASEARVYYFRVYPYQIDTSILINGQESITWNQASKNASSRVFTISSEIPWTAETEADWITLAQEDNLLTIYVVENSTILQERQTLVTVSNGYDTASIVLLQGYSKGNTLEWPVLSMDEMNPTVISSGGQYFTVTSGHEAILQIYEWENSQYSLVFESEWDYEMHVGMEGEPFQFENNKKYKIELLDVWDENYKQNEILDDIIKSTYYVIVHDDASYVIVNGTTETDIVTTSDEFKVYINSSGLVSFETDVDWLKIPQEYQASNQNNRKTIRATGYNMTEDDRLGHIYLSCGTASATITVVQKSVIPRMVFPEGVSTDENNPTLMPYGNIRYTVMGNTVLWYEKQGDEYNYIEDTYQVGTFQEWTGYLTSNELKPGTQYKILVGSPSDEDVYYYIMTETSSLTNAVLLNGSEEPLNLETGADTFSQTVKIKGKNRWTASSSASWLTCSVTSGTTTQKSATIKATANTTGEERSAVITFLGGSSSKKYPVNYIRVTQLAENDTSAQNPQDYLTLCISDNGRYHLLQPDDTAYLRSSKTSESFVILSNKNVIASSDSDWIQLSAATIEPQKTLKVTLKENNTGSLRFGNVTLTNGTVSKTIEFSQVPSLSTPVLISPDLSTSYKTPTPFDCSAGEVLFTWNGVDNAVYYNVYVRSGSNNNKSLHSTRIEADERLQYSFTCPLDWLRIDSGEYHSIEISAVDQYGYSAYEYWYFYPQSGDGVYIGGKLAPVWDNVTDYAVTSDAYSVMSTGTWTARSDSPWMMLSRTSGASGDSFTVSLTQNEGAARTGHVAVTCGTVTSYLTVNQCAAIPMFPALTYPNISDDEDNPTILPAGIEEIEINWDVEPQAEEYSLILHTFIEEGRYRVVKKVSAKELKVNGEYTGQYTLTDLDLTVGNLYELTFLRSNNGRLCGHGYYFVLDDGLSYVTIGNGHENEVELEGDGEGHCFTVKASGYWSAESDADWLTIGSRYIDEDYLSEKGDSAIQHMTYRGNSGDGLYYYALPNLTGASRTATITIRAGASTATFIVKQEKMYTLAIITSPALSTNHSAPTRYTYGAMSVNWSEASGGTGRYSLSVDEYDGSDYNNRTQVFKKEKLTSRSYTIPATTFTEGKYYRLRLGTEVETDDGYYTNSYYFRVPYTNELAVSITTSGTGKVGDGVSIRADATASGGSGTGYKYVFYLMQNGEIVSRSDGWNNFSYWTFSVQEAGDYYVQVTVKDSTGEMVTENSNTISATEHTEDFVLINSATALTREIANNGGSTIVAVRALTNWSATADVDWLTLDWSGAKESSLSATATANTSSSSREGHVTVTCGSASATLTVFQNGAGTVSVSENSVSFTAAVGSRQITVASSGNWSATKSDNWISISPSSGANGATLTISVTANTSLSSRNGSVTISAGGASTTVSVAQAGSGSGSDGVQKVQMRNTIETGVLTDIIVNVQNATYVRMTIDGKYVTDPFIVNEFNAAYVRYSFSSSGARELTFSALVNGVWVDHTTKYTLYVTAPNGTLDSPNVSVSADTVDKGQSVNVSWTDNGNATAYTVYVYKDGALFKKFDKQSTKSVTLTGSDLSLAGQYAITVMSAAQGYNQGEGSAQFSVQWQGYLQQKTATVYSDESLTRSNLQVRFGNLYTILSEKEVNGKLVGTISNGGQVLGYTDASAFGTEYWHPCLKDGIYIHTWYTGYEAEHPHKVFQKCSECEITEYTDSIATNASPDINSCCICGNHTYELSHYQASHPHYAMLRCVRCQAMFVDTSSNIDKFEGCPECEEPIIAPLEASSFEKLFWNPGYNESKSLRRFSVDLAFATYSGAYSLQRDLESYGFQNVEVHNFSGSYTTDAYAKGHYIAFAIAWRDIILESGDKTQLFVIVGRGTTDNVEWQSNFNIGTGSTHLGFNMAAIDVFECFKNYYAKYSTASGIDYKVWVTGHSRAAAVANLLGAIYLPSLGLSSSDLYDYTFACPNVTTNSVSGTGFGIQNYIIRGDLIPMVPLSNWGYQRYGVVHSIDNLRTKNGHEYNLPEETYTVCSQLYSYAQTPEEYRTKLFSDVTKLIGEQGSWVDIGKVLVKLLPTFFVGWINTVQWAGRLGDTHITAYPDYFLYGN